MKIMIIKNKTLKYMSLM